MLEHFSYTDLIRFLASNAVWAIQENGNTYYRDGPAGNWIKISNPKGARLKQIDVGGLGVFGVDSNCNIYYRIGTHQNPQSTGSDWQKYELFS